MTKEDLIAYKKELSKLSEEEKKKRDLYLRSLATGEILGPTTGYPSVDKPWLKYYDSDKINIPVNNETMYQFLLRNNKDNLEGIAIDYFGKKITYKELFFNINKCAKSLIALGVKEGDTIGICAPSTPEAVYILYAINRLGAVANLIDVRKSSSDIEHCLNIGNTKYLFVYDGQVDRINSLINKTSVKSIISLSPVESLNPVVKMIAAPKQTVKNMKYAKSNNKNFLLYSEFIDHGKKVTDIPLPKYIKGKPSFIEYTSGSTGKPKAVALSDDTANEKVLQYLSNGVEFSRGDKYLDIIPIFIAFGTIFGIHLPLSMGITDQIIPDFDSKKINSIINKNKPNHMILTPDSYVEFINSKQFKKQNIDFVKTWGCGGDGMNSSQEKMIDDALASHGSNYKVYNGYGASEVGAPFATEKDGITPYGSVGIPLPGNNIAILEHGTNNELGYNQIGDVCMITNCPMLGYLNNEELSNSIKVTLHNGEEGIVLGDSGYVTENGILYVKGRTENAILDKNEQIVWPVDIENDIMSLGVVSKCAAVKNVAKTIANCDLYIVLNKGVSENIFKIMLKTFLEKYNNINFNVYIVDNLKLTSSGKIDRRLLSSLSINNEYEYQKKLVL